MTDRRLVTNLAVSVDGRYAKPDNHLDMSWVMPYAVSDAARDHLTSLWEPATTALMGRVNAEGFLGFWPTVIDMEGADPRDVGFAKWLVDVDKVVMSRTPATAPWERARIESRPLADVVAELKGEEGGDILVPSSPDVIKQLLAADLVDVLAMTVFPVFLGGGPRLFEDGLPTGTWRLARRRAGSDGELMLAYERLR